MEHYTVPEYIWEGMLVWVPAKCREEEIDILCEVIHIYPAKGVAEVMNMVSSHCFLVPVRDIKIKVYEGGMIIRMSEIRHEEYDENGESEGTT